MNICIGKGIVQSIGPRPDVGLKKYRVIVGDSVTVLPGLIDCHVHLALDGINFQASLKQWKNPSSFQARLREEMKAYLLRGIVAVRDGSAGRFLLLPAGDKKVGNKKNLPLLPAG